MMRINSIPPNDLLSKYVTVRNRVSPAKAPCQRVDQAALTEHAKTFSASLRTVKDALVTRTAEDQARIEAITEQIRQNTYSVPGYKVAEKIIGKP